MLDPIQNHALRLCLGAYRTCPTSSLCVEANEAPLYFRQKKLSLLYCLKLSCNYNNPAYTAVLILNYTLYLKENLSYLLLQSVLQVICKRLVSKRVMLLHFPFQPHRLLTRPVVNFTLHCADKINTPPKMFKYRSYEVTSSRITIAYLLMALKMVTELLLLWSIETILSVFDYLTQQASSEQNYTRFCL